MNKNIDLGSTLWRIDGADDAIALFGQISATEQHNTLLDVANELGYIRFAQMLPNLSDEQKEFLESTETKLCRVIKSLLETAEPEALAVFYPVV